jgi:hypothetical protein
MSQQGEFDPDEKILTGKEIDERLEEHGLSLKEIITSRSPGMDEVRYGMRRRKQPDGWLSWQLPAYLKSKTSTFFLSAGAPGAILPGHAHEFGQFRIVLSGGVIFNGVELRSGDWMYIPAGKPYSLTASLNPGGATTHYMY